MKRRIQIRICHLMALVAAVLSALATKAKTPDGNSLANAIPLGSIGVSISRNGTLTTADPVDYYHFKVEGSVRAVRVRVPAAIAPNAHVRLLTWPDPNADPIPLAEGDSNVNTHSDFTTNLTVGTYYIEITTPEFQNRLYELQLSQTLPDKTPPFIMFPLAHVTVPSGQAGVLSAGAEGSFTLSYQWSFNGTPISGATASQLRIDGATASQAGSYSVTVTSEFGSVTSTAATLTVTPPGSGAGHRHGGDHLLAGFR